MMKTTATDTPLVEALDASAVLRVGYFFPACWTLERALHWREIAPSHPHWLWPVQWMSWLDHAVAGPWLFGATITGLLLACVVPQYAWARWLGAVCLLEHLAFSFSLGKIHHLMHGWLLVLWVLCWLPRGWTRPTELSPTGRRRTLKVFHTCQLLVATTYTLSGVGKVIGAGYQWWLGQPTLLHPLALARHTAARLLETSDESLLGRWVIDHGNHLWPATLAVTLLQVGAVWLARRPRFHRALGAGLIGFHALTTLTMNIDFTPAVVLCGLLFVASPFHATSSTT